MSTGDKDPVLERYPDAKPGNGTPGYIYEFDGFTVTKNITGTGGWIGVVHESNSDALDGHNVDDIIKKCRRRKALIEMVRIDEELGLYDLPREGQDG